MQENYENPLLQNEISEEEKKRFLIGQYKQDFRRMAQFEDPNHALYGQEVPKGIVQRKLDGVVAGLIELGIDPATINVNE